MFADFNLDNPLHEQFALYASICIYIHADLLLQVSSLFCLCKM